MRDLVLDIFANGNELNEIQKTFDLVISTLTDYLDLQPIYSHITVSITDGLDDMDANLPILDLGVKRASENGKLSIEVHKNHKKFFPFILLREACYCFIHSEPSKYVKICINQIIENILNKISVYKDWKSLLRDSLVDKDFIASEFDRLQKFFTIGVEEPFESTSQFFFREMRNDVLLCRNNTINRFYDIIFEKYSDKTFKFLFNSEIIETLTAVIKIFYETKSYLSSASYKTLFKKFKESKLIDTDLSVRKFIENLDLINKFSPIAPSYDRVYSKLHFYNVQGHIKFNPLLSKEQIDQVIEKWPFFYLSILIINGFALELFVSFHVPKVYLKDFSNYFNNMEESGYIIENRLYSVLRKINSINFNYCTDIANINKIPDPNTSKYQKKYEIECETDYPIVSRPTPLSILEYTIFDRVFSVSVTGLTFDKRIETLNAIKEDVKNELRKQEKITTKFKKSLAQVANSSELKQHVLNFLNNNIKHGFLYTYSQLSQTLKYINLMEKILDSHPKILNTFQAQKFFNTNTTPYGVKEYILLQNEKIKRIINRDFLTLYFKSKKTYLKALETFRASYNVLDACYNLRIVDIKKIIKIVRDSNLAEELCQTREAKYMKLTKSAKLYAITSEKIDSAIEKFLNLNPPMLKPVLINTFLTSTFAKYSLGVLLEDTPEIRKKISEFRIYFPRVYTNINSGLVNKEKVIRLLIYAINIKEKEILISVFNTIFRNAIIKYRRYFWRGVSRRSRFELKDFYDYDKGEFIYAEDLYKQTMLYSKKIFGEKLTWPKYMENDYIRKAKWSNKKKIDDLINTVKRRVTFQDINFSLEELYDLSKLLYNLESSLLDREKFKIIKEKKFYKRYIKSIFFIPAFQYFGFSQYCLYLRPFFYDSEEWTLDFKLLFGNSFQNIKYPVSIEHDSPLFIEYIYPINTPNTAYLNWLIKSKKNIAEYCLFRKKKIYDQLHFNRNISKEGLDYSAIQFESYMQEVLSNPSYNPQISGIREFDMEDRSEQKIYEPDTEEFEALTHIYNTHSIDIKSFLSSTRFATIEKIQDLMRKKLIFPCISLKNLDFKDKISIILPDVNSVVIEKTLKIFNFFNMCRIYEIEGEFFIHGFDKKKSFESGLLIELWFPECNLDEFLKVFYLMFQYFKIKHPLILANLVKGDNLLKTVYGSLSFLKDYNPLLNFKWNDKDKIWMNPKLFTEKFEPIYPDLIKKN